MTDNNDFIKQRKLIITQLLLTILIVVFYAKINNDIMAGLSALAGCVVALINTALFLVSAVIARTTKEVKQGIVIAYLLAGVRFVLVAVLFAMGAILGLSMLPMIVGFIVLQLGQLVNLIYR